MAESIVQVTEGSGKKLHTWSYTVGANTVEDEFTLPGEFPYASYSIQASGVSLATSSDHVLTINAGASLKVRLRRLRFEQSGNATAVSTITMILLRTTTGAPTGGTAITPAPFDTGDAASGATARSIPAVKGTESTELMRFVVDLRQALLATAAQMDDGFEWVQLPNQKAIVIPTGTTNGLALKISTGVAGATGNIYAEFVETAF